MRRLLLLALLPTLASAQDPKIRVPRGPLVTLDVRFATAPEAAAAPKSGVDVLDARALAALLPNLKKISAPRVTVFDDQEATVSVINQHAFVRARDKAGKAVNDAVQSGIVLKARPTIAGKKVSLAFSLTQAKLSEPIAKLQTPRGDIELPLITTEEVRATLDVTDRGTVSLRIRSRGSKESIIVTVRATIVRLAEIKKPN